MVTVTAISISSERSHRRGGPRYAASACSAGGFAASLGGACALTILTAASGWSATFDCVIDPSLTLKLGSPIVSILDSVAVERGDLVKGGEVIARLESTVEQAAVAVNEARADSPAEIEAKKAVVELKRGILARKVGLQHSYASPQDIENAQAE